MGYLVVSFKPTKRQVLEPLFVEMVFHVETCAVNHVSHPVVPHEIHILHKESENEEETSAEVQSPRKSPSMNLTEPKEAKNMNE